MPMRQVQQQMIWNVFETSLFRSNAQLNFKQSEELKFGLIFRIAVVEPNQDIF